MDTPDNIATTSLTPCYPRILEENEEFNIEVQPLRKVPMMSEDSGIFTEDTMDVGEEAHFQYNDGNETEGIAEGTDDEKGDDTEDEAVQELARTSRGSNSKLIEDDSNCIETCSPFYFRCVSQAMQSNDQYTGPPSPVSVQGSEGSIEFLDRTVAGIERKNEIVRGVQSQLWTTSVPLNVHRLLEKAVNDPVQFHFILSAFRQSIMTMAYATNECQLDSVKAKDLMQTLQTMDNNTFSAVAGHYMMTSKRVMNCKEQSTSGVNPQSKPPTKAPENLQCKSPIRKKSKGKKTTSMLQTPTPKQTIIVEDEVWEKANFAFETNDTDNRRIEKVGQVFFKAVMTKEDIKARSISGRNMAGKFDDGKMSWIKAACAYIWTRPAKIKRNTLSFMSDWSSSSFDLDAEMWRTLKVRVFTNYASRERKKIFDGEKAANTGTKANDV